MTLTGSLITVDGRRPGVANNERARSFYEAMGWSVAMDGEETAFFQAGGTILVLWSRELGGHRRRRRRREVGRDHLAHNVRSREEVHAVIDDARKNGAEVTREPAETFYGGYAGIFRDLDGHAWEVAHNPGFELDERGGVVLPI
jgi:uncharacterized protein